MLVVDPPDHTRFRRLVSRALHAPRHEPRSSPLVQGTADSAPRRPRTTHRHRSTWSKTYAAQLPVLVIADLLGVPADRREDFLRWGAAAAATLDPGLSFGRDLAPERGKKLNGRASSGSTSSGWRATRARTW